MDTSAGTDKKYGSQIEDALCLQIIQIDLCTQKEDRTGICCLVQYLENAHYIELGAVKGVENIVRKPGLTFFFKDCVGYHFPFRLGDYCIEIGLDLTIVFHCISPPSYSFLYSHIPVICLCSQGER